MGNLFTFMSHVDFQVAIVCVGTILGGLLGFRLQVRHDGKVLCHVAVVVSYALVVRSEICWRSIGCRATHERVLL